MSDRISLATGFYRKIAGASKFDGGALESLEISPRLDHLALNRDDAALARETYRKLAVRAELNPSEQFALEAIIIPDRRPAIDIVRGEYSEVLHLDWTSLNDAATRSTLQAAFRSIGRIEVVGYPGLPYGGTGFVVGDGLLMTNRHVAELFAAGLGKEGLTFISGRGSSIDFARDPDGAQQLHVRSVAMIHPYWDMALLQVDGLTEAHPVLTLAARSANEFKDETVVIVGYPAFDPRNAPEVQDRVFNRKYNVKRLLPGKGGLRRVQESFGNNVLAFTHDASTLGGNSGSAVVDPASGNIVGLHFAGIYLDANFAVPAWELSRDQRVIDAGVRFTEPSGDQVVTREWWRRVDSVAEVATPVDKTSSAMSTATKQVGDVATIFVPIEISVRVGEPASSAAIAATATARERRAFTRAREKEPITEKELVTGKNCDVLKTADFDLDKAVFLAKASQAAYGDAAQTGAWASAQGFTRSEFFDIANVQGFWCVDDEIALLVFRGTSNPGQWLRDARFLPVSYPWGFVHIGFRDGVAVVEPALAKFDSMTAPNKLVWVTGHSLGGAVALIAAARLKMKSIKPLVHTFGQPRVGLGDFAERYAIELPERLWRFVNQSDIVTRVPPGPVYQHTGIVKRIVRPGVLEAVAATQARIALEAPLLRPEAERRARMNEIVNGGAALESANLASAAALERAVVIDRDVAPLTELEFSQLQVALGAAENREAPLGPVTEGLFSWLEDHAISEYIRLLEDIRAASA
jgi:V8-like Glu-specific endopeptidase